MPSKPPRSLSEMASDAGSGIQCPKCGCRDFRVYGHAAGTSTAVMRYKRCRHCGHRVLTSTKSDEHILRDVDARDEDELSDPESMLNVVA